MPPNGSEAPEAAAHRPGVLARREVLLRGAAAALAVGSPRMAVGTRRSADRPAQRPGTTLVTVQYSPSTPTALKLAHEAFSPFLAANRDIQVEIVAPPSSNPAAILGGAGNDLILDWYYPSFMQPPLLLDLSPYIRADNVDMSVLPKRSVELFTLPGSVFALPAHSNAWLFVVNLSLFDQLGLTYPDPGWDYREFTKIARETTSTTSKNKRYGTYLPWYTNGPRLASFLFNGFGGALTDATRTKSLLASPQAINLGNWVYQDLFWPGVAAPMDYWNVSASLTAVTTGQVAMQNSWYGSPFQYAEALRTSIKWQYYPYPHFPNGRATHGSNPFYAINAQTKHPNEAWRILKWLTFEPTFQLANLRLTGTIPVLSALVPDYATLAEAAAPPLRNRGLQWFVDAIVKDYAYPEVFYRYDDHDARGVVKPLFTGLFARQSSVIGAFTQAAKLIDATENALQAEQSAIKNLARVRVSKGSAYSAPVRSGPGAPATPAAHYAVFDPKRHTLAVLGDGNAPVGNGGTDSTVFPCTAVTATEGEWVCRVTALASVSCPRLSQWTQVGLMARSSLGAASQMLTVNIEGTHGVWWIQRTLANTPASSGGAGASLIKPNTQQHHNYLLAPVWLKLQRQGLTWSTYWSQDGQSWNLVGSMVANFGGAWVGAFVNPNNGDFGNKGYLRALFDHVSFAPTDFVQIGNQGIPPGAGAVPANWAQG